LKCQHRKLKFQYNELLVKKVTGTCYYMDNLKGMAALGDLSLRLKHMDQYEGYRQVLSIGVPPVELVLPPKDAVELSRIANDEMAEVLNKYPDRFVAALACLPMDEVWQIRSWKGSPAEGSALNPLLLPCPDPCLRMFMGCSPPEVSRLWGVQSQSRKAGVGDTNNCPHPFGLCIHFPVSQK
jgi:hypothetical protein